MGLSLPTNRQRQLAYARLGLDEYTFFDGVFLAGRQLWNVRMPTRQTYVVAAVHNIVYQMAIAHQDGLRDYLNQGPASVVRLISRYPRLSHQLKSQLTDLHSEDWATQDIRLFDHQCVDKIQGISGNKLGARALEDILAIKLCIEAIDRLAPSSDSVKQAFDVISHRIEQLKPKERESARKHLTALGTILSPRPGQG